MKINPTYQSYYRILAAKLSLPLLMVFGIAILYLISMPQIDHKTAAFPVFVLVLVLIKSIVIFIVTFKQISKLISVCHSLEKLVWTFGLIIVITILSFATDYTCIYQSDQSAFNGLGVYTQSYFSNLLHFLYFSVITFATVGYGDIIPVSNLARLVVIFEIFMSFIIIIFALSNIKKIHLYE